MKINVAGTVQGVLFRQFCKENADKLGLKGFTRNLKNGNVEIIVEGDIDNVDKMVEVVRKGPKHAMIKNVDAEEKRWSGEFEGFKILRF